MSNSWCLLVISLPGQSGTVRMRVWRALKARGAGILRDGVYLLPETPELRSSLAEQASNVESAGGSAYLLSIAADDAGLDAQFRGFFERGPDYDAWLTRLAGRVEELGDQDEAEARRGEAQLRRELETITATDYFPGEARTRALRALDELGATVNASFSPEEPNAAPGPVPVCDSREFQGRHWATRRDLWVDRVASAWLIRRFIDPRAMFDWLAKPGDCAADAVGFDFDGATFSHVEDLVTFEVLLRSFQLLENPALARIGALVHYLDVGGVPVAEAAGFLTMLAGVKHRCDSDDELLQATTPLLDYLYDAYTASASHGAKPC